MRGVGAFVAVFFGVVLACACGPSTSPSRLPDLSGTWVGMLGEPRSGSALRVTWVATQTGATVLGPATVLKAAANVPATGTMSGTLSGSGLTLTYSVPAGAVPVYLSCAVEGNGAATATAGTISGTLQTTFTSCLGSGLETPESPRLILEKQ
jgi:hypothetical protein